MKRLQRITLIVTILALGGLHADAWARAKTGVLEKKKVDGDKLEFFSDTVYNYKLTTPVGWDFSIQKEKSDDELNPFRLKMRMKDKQVPAELWDARNVVTHAQIFLFIIELDWDPKTIRDSLIDAEFKAEWQKPIVKHCELMSDGVLLQELDIRWENEWKGFGYSVRREYTAQIPTGGGLFGSVTEVLLGEFYVFPFKGKRMIVHMVSEREFLEENRNTCKEILFQIGELQP